MVFVSSELGEHSITTRDIDVNENTIIQFEVLETRCICNCVSTHYERLPKILMAITKSNFSKIT